MHLPHQFYRFPFLFDVDRLRHEVEAVPESCWLRHPQDFRGNSALPLIATDGGLNDDFTPPMHPTEHLERSPYIRQLLAQFHTLLGRARLMRLEPGAGVPPHSDAQYYWRTHTRVHVPIITHPDIRFYCGKEVVHMAAGEAWTFNNWRMHKVVNETPTRRVHLTFDTYGSSAFWAMAQPLGSEWRPSFVPFREGVTPELSFESFAGDCVMSPGELDYELSRLVADIGACAENDPAMVFHLEALTTRLRNDWRVIWYSWGPTAEGLPHFEALSNQATLEVAALGLRNVKLASNTQSVLEPLVWTFTAMIKKPRQTRVGTN